MTALRACREALAGAFDGAALRGAEGGFAEPQGTVRPGLA
jgi:hypothetical protein